MIRKIDTDIGGSSGAEVSGFKLELLVHFSIWSPA